MIIVCDCFKLIFVRSRSTKLLCFIFEMKFYSNKLNETLNSKNMKINLCSTMTIAFIIKIIYSTIKCRILNFEHVLIFSISFTKFMIIARSKLYSILLKFENDNLI